mmetsp:Transcript_35077/g.101377  ORF Transcript_35077/g.101377 Transcript_35077/m.101377 type:complete len:340 (-) Transcript_35077:2047-3066(-)
MPSGEAMGEAGASASTSSPFQRYFSRLMCVSQLKPPQMSSSGLPTISDLAVERRTIFEGLDFDRRSTGAHKYRASVGNPPSPCHMRMRNPMCRRMSMGTRANGRKVQSTSGSISRARTMEKTCAEPGPRLSVARLGSRPQLSAKAMHKSRGAPVNSSCSMMDGAVAPMRTDPVGIIITFKPCGIDTPQSLSDKSSPKTWPFEVVGWMTLEAKPRTLRNTRSLWARMKTVWPSGITNSCFSFNSENMLPTLKSGGRTKCMPSAKMIDDSSATSGLPRLASLLPPGLPTLRISFARMRASRRSDRWSSWFSRAAISRRETTARCMLTKTWPKMPTYLPTLR